MTRDMRPPAPPPSAPTTGHGLSAPFTKAGDQPLCDPAGEPDFAAIQASPEFTRLRRRLRLFVFPMSALFFCWYLTFALLSAYGHEFMRRKAVGEINVGTLFGLLQFLSTIMIVVTYARFAKRRLDPQVDRIREQVRADAEGGRK
ncbi:DUF485 domain-containing protein [Streptomyces sp. GS7]|uniref:DUF485 domain-containing protein n=1 Tax=Streptomyces sp. GS7 TaxID=2692234 RepID=UPI001318F863|nr:DUF485 domain-containing protein [Streptomyces sp. GS7]QHC23052.1 DUF485 domain-containing protein [Streptomyces sp. GS7]